MTDGMSEVRRSKLEGDEWMRVLEGVFEGLERIRKKEDLLASKKVLDILERIQGGNPKAWLEFLGQVKARPGISRDPASIWMRLKGRSPFAGKALLWLEPRTNGSALVGEVELHLVSLINIASVEVVRVAPGEEVEVYVVSPHERHRMSVKFLDP